MTFPPLLTRGAKAAYRTSTSSKSRLTLEPSQQNENQNDKENDVQTAGRVTSPASTVRPAVKHCDHSVWENRRQGASWNQKSKAAFSVPGLTHSLSLIIVTRQRMLELLLLSSSIERTTPVKDWTFSPSLVPRIVIGACSSKDALHRVASFLVLT